AHIKNFALIWILLLCAERLSSPAAENRSDEARHERRSAGCRQSGAAPECVKTFRETSVSKAEWRCKKPKSPFSQGSQSGQLKIGLNIAWMGGGEPKKRKNGIKFL
ncbi:MAG TPA: hypothetical protein VEC93_22700, partial [Anaerolineae bacterium]|nr:hypothetical protein [Anaerolineae bacterium]